MAIITTPNYLRQGVEAIINPQEKTIHLVSDVEDPRSNISLEGEKHNNGVTFSAFYSFLKVLWREDDELIKYNFPLQACSRECFELIHEWTLSEETRNILRQGHCYALGDIYASDEVFKWKSVHDHEPSDNSPLLIRAVNRVNQDFVPYHCTAKYNVDTKEFMYDHPLPPGAEHSVVTHFIEIKDPLKNDGHIVEDPNLLIIGEDIIINTDKKTIKLRGKSKNLDSNIYDVVTNESDRSKTGVSFKCLRLFLYEQWRNNYDLIGHPAPLGGRAASAKNVDEFSLENGWKFADAYTSGLLR